MGINNYLTLETIKKEDDLEWECLKIKENGE